jgi:hypothetical protein
MGIYFRMVCEGVAPMYFLNANKRLRPVYDGLKHYGRLWERQLRRIKERAEHGQPGPKPTEPPQRPRST